MSETPSLFDALEKLEVAADALVIGWGNYSHGSPELTALEDALIDALGNVRIERVKQRG